jgi:RND family efflux transporter MFP subunit
MNDPAPNLPRAALYARRTAIGTLVVLLVSGGGRLLLNLRSANALASSTEASLSRTVLVTRAQAGELVRKVSLPTTLRGATESSIYSRSSGYLTAWHKDIGDPVRKGELLATIDAPEQEQELAQAQAIRAQIQARLNLARQTVDRWESLRDQAALSKQALEEKRSDAVQAQADLAAATANVRRLEQLKNFRRIVAPFDGVITRRGAEIGDLIAPGEKELFAVAQTDPLRLTIWIPQVYAGDVKVGDEVGVSLSELPGKSLVATIERLAGGIDAQTRARQVDLKLPNPGATLFPGAYAEVTVTLSGGANALVAPASVLMLADQVPRVALVGEDNRVAFRSVQLGRDLGREVEILGGISQGDTMVVSPSDQLVEGEVVRTRAWESPAGKSRGAAGTAAARPVAAATH